MVGLQGPGRVSALNLQTSMGNAGVWEDMGAESVNAEGEERQGKFESNCSPCPVWTLQGSAAGRTLTGGGDQATT